MKRELTFHTCTLLARFCLLHDKKSRLGGSSLLQQLRGSSVMECASPCFLVSLLPPHLGIRSGRSFLSYSGALHPKETEASASGIWVRNMQTAQFSSAEKSNVVVYLFECVCVRECVCVCVCVCLCVWGRSGGHILPVCLAMNWAAYLPARNPAGWKESLCVCVYVCVSVWVCVLTSHWRFPRHIIYTLYPPNWHTQTSTHTHTHRNVHTHLLANWSSNILGARKLAWL